MKRLFILLLALCLASSAAWAQTEGDFAYSISGGEAKITAYTGSAAELTLPDTLGGCPVTSIGVCAFRDCKTLTQVTTPDSVTRIGSRAFHNCHALAQITIPESVVRIDTHAFYGCASLRQLVLHDRLSDVNILAFYGCSAIRLCDADSLTAFVLTDVGYTFTDPDYPQLALKAYEDTEGRRTFTVADCDASAVSVSFPDRVTAIDRYAFFGCAQLTEITLPEGVAAIEKSAFEGCSSLSRMTIPGSVSSIAEDAFALCPDVTVVAPYGSAAHLFAEANGLAWQAL
ncbi:MAG: leucine-rich repeat domain-containing protein [Oscillospiraceae bacterium]|nr:leucine-rich repeat domain-containing protein [Oscillospiraceae bacterium]